MFDMTNETRQEIVVHSWRMGRYLSYAMLAFGLYILVMAFINNPMKSYGVSFAMSLILIVPLALLADHVSGEVMVGEAGLTRTGLLGRKTIILWDRIKKISLVRNSSGIRELIVIGYGKKIVLSNTFFLISKPNFWEAAFKVIDRADAAGWPIKIGILGREAWFYHGSTYLPGEQFKDRRDSLEAPQGRLIGVRGHLSGFDRYVSSGKKSTSPGPRRAAEKRPSVLFAFQPLRVSPLGGGGVMGPPVRRDQYK